MHRCFELAKLGKGYVSPNPMVGAVLVHNDNIIGEGYHQQFGEAHAEVNCLNSVAEKDMELISDATLYLNLEPCSHFGKTPPCTDLIIRHKIKNVVISTLDASDKVNGKGVQRLREHDVNCITGILEKEGSELNKHFFYFHKHNLPYITLKYAQSHDGYIGVIGKEIKISNDATQRYVHQLRASHQAIAVGKNTVLSDNPSLTVRFATGKNPIRIVLGSEHAIPKDYHVFNNEASTFFYGRINDEAITIQELLQQLAKNNIISLLVEGGANVLQQFIDNNAWNEAHIITAQNNMQIISNENIDTYIKAPVISGTLQENCTLQTDNIQVLKNPNALSYS